MCKSNERDYCAADRKVGTVLPMSIKSRILKSKEREPETWLDA